MQVPSAEFLIFAAFGAILFNIASGIWRRVVFLALCVAFLASYSLDPRSFVPLAGFLLAGYLAQLWVGGENRRAFFVFCIVAMVAMFSWLKQYLFFPTNTFLPFPYVQLGMSYMFFRMLQVIIDRHQSAIKYPVGFLSYISYLLNFTAIVAGPIQRYEDFRDDEVTPLPLDSAAITFGLRRVILGCFKVIAVSTILQMTRDPIFAALASAHGLLDRAIYTACFIAGYALYLYFNFSGYTDVVIGVARFYRKSLPENFDRPFSSVNFISFWSRWHMSLSNWLKTYVYNPLLTAMMERITSPDIAPFLAVIAFFVTFFLVGIWHGQTSEFLFFGILQGGGVAVNKLYQLEMARRLGRQRYRALSARPLYVIMCRGLTFSYFGITLLWFASDWSQIGTLAKDAGVAGMALAILLMWIVSAIVLSGWESIRGMFVRATSPDGSRNVGQMLNSRYAQTVWLTALCVSTIVVVIALNAPAPEVVYKGF